MDGKQGELVRTNVELSALHNSIYVKDFEDYINTRKFCA